MAQPRVKTEVFNALCFTDFSLRKWTIDELSEYKIKYVGYGVETCPDTKKTHHQGWLYAHTDAKRSFKAWKKVFKALGLEKMHFEKMQGNFAQNAKYISKEGQLVEIGEKPMGNGKKRTIFEYKKQIENGESVLDIAESDEKFGTFLQYRPAEIILIFWRKEFFCFLFFHFSIFLYLRLFIEIIHEPLSLEEGTLAEDNSLQAQAYLVLDRREEVRQAP